MGVLPELRNESFGSLALPLKPDVDLYDDDMPDNPEAFLPKDTEAELLGVPWHLWLGFCS